MSIQELLESAQLDALGLLDEQDREAFERAFAAAPAALQAQLRREQARLCHIDALLPEVELPDAVWPKVRDAVREAQLNATNATGAVHAHAGSDRAARPLPMSRSGAVNRLWRAAAIGFATAAVVLGGAVIHLRLTAERNSDIENVAGESRDLVSAFGRQYLSEQLFGNQCDRFVMRDDSGKSRGQAAVYTSPEWPGAVLYCRVAAPEGTTLRLVELTDAGEIGDTLTEFASNGALETREFQLKNANPKRLALVAAPRGQAAAKGEIILRMA